MLGAWAAAAWGAGHGLVSDPFRAHADLSRRRRMPCMRCVANGVVLRLARKAWASLTVTWPKGTQCLLNR